jgi:hypothetical protein
VGVFFLGSCFFMGYDPIRIELPCRSSDHRSPQRRKGLNMAKGWDTSKGRTHVVVAFWGAETTVTFHFDENEAIAAYDDAVNHGADVFYSKTIRMRKNAPE